MHTVRLLAECDLQLICQFSFLKFQRFPPCLYAFSLLQVDSLRHWFLDTKWDPRLQYPYQRKPQDTPFASYRDMDREDRQSNHR